MISILHFGSVLLPLLYLGLTLAYVHYFRRDSQGALAICRAGTPLLILIHIVYLVLLGRDLGRPPLGTLLEFLSVLALGILVIYAVLERRYRVLNTGFLVVGLALLFQFLASAFMPSAVDTERPLLAERGYVLHAVLVLMAYTALSLGFLYSLVYVIQARQLTARRFGLLYQRLPSLDLLERMSVGAVKLGVPLLFAAIVTGHFWMNALAGRLGETEAAGLTHVDAKIFSAWGNLAIYGIGLLGHRFWGWRGRRMSYLAIAAFLVVVAATAVVHHFLPSFHNFTPGVGA